MSTYIVADGRIRYQVERGVDFAISEYAPGRSIVVDKNTYQIGGLYCFGSERHKGQASCPARKFIDDPNYVKELLTCKCGWFGLAEENHSSCPFCGSRRLSRSEKKMLRPWGFAPLNAEAISEAQLTEEYSTAQPPEYSTLPEHDEMLSIDGCKNIRMASRKNQRIIMLNRGSNERGFAVCKDCGAAAPNTKEKPLAGVGRPYKSKYAQSECRHSNTMIADLGCDFITDMLVLEFALDARRLDTRRGDENLWLTRAAQSVAEAFRLAAVRELDIEFGELMTGCRIRTGDSGKTFVDVYICDNLSSGAGYSVRIASEIVNLLEKMRALLSSCRCATACGDCLKHYRNRYVHGRLDRWYGLDLLDWGIEGRVASKVPFDVQRRYLESLSGILSEYDRDIRAEDGKLYVVGGCVRSEVVICPAMRAKPTGGGKIYISESYMKYAKPYALRELLSACNLG